MGQTRGEMATTRMFLVTVICVALPARLLACPGSVASPSGEVNFRELRGTFDDEYSLLATEIEEYRWYDDDDAEPPKPKKYYFKKDKVGKKRYQAGYTPDSAYSIQQADEKGVWTYYGGFDREDGGCDSYKRPCMHDHTSADLYSEYKLVNTRTEGSKTYLQFYYNKYNRENWKRTKGWWTTVYDTNTKSYLPYEKHITWKGDGGKGFKNVTYVPTQIQWVKLPDDC